MENKAKLREQEVQEEKNRLMEVIEENMSENTIMMEGNNNMRFSVNYSVTIRKTVNTNEMARQIVVTYTFVKEQETSRSLIKLSWYLSQ